MEIFFEQIEEAKKAVKLADHLTYVTFPLIGDDKIMNMITDNLQISLLKALDALLNYEKYYKRVVSVPESFEDKLSVFKNEVSKRYDISSESLLAIREINEVVNNRKKSINAEFLKKDNVLLFNEYKLKTLNIKKIKEYINLAKLLINKINTIVGKNARGF